MHKEKAAIQVNTTDEFYEELLSLLTDRDKLKLYQDRAYSFSKSKENVISTVMENIKPVLQELEHNN